MNAKINRVEKLSGEIFVPGDKSVSHRAAILGAIGSARTLVYGYLEGSDCLATLSCLRTLGVRIDSIKSENGLNLEIYGCGIDGFKEPEDILNCDNSGTLIRMLTGLLSGQKFYSVLTGDSSIRKRPMKRIVDPLAQMGACILGRGDGNFAPLAVKGRKLQGISYTMPVASAQVKSSILFAALLGEGETNIIEPVPSRDHTERMLEAFGADIRMETDDETGFRSIRLKPGVALQGQEIRIPGDISSAAFLIVAGLLVPDSHIIIKNVGINPLRTGIIDVLQNMGANIEVIPRGTWCGELVGDMKVSSSRLCGTTITGAMIPRLIDEIPILALAAACAEGETVIEGASELRVKESDRISVVATQLNRLGANVKELPDGMVIQGVLHLTGGGINSAGDHRIALMGAVAGLISENGVEIDDFDCAKVSYPGFLNDINRISQ
jgi:3-phosphoshikimate 1-carboxyvinyltransferase